jgi:hypothetical protein
MPKATGIGFFMLSFLKIILKEMEYLDSGCVKMNKRWQLLNKCRDLFNKRFLK